MRSETGSATRRRRRNCVPRARWAGLTSGDDNRGTGTETPPTVLLADQHQLFRTGLRHLLERRGFRVVADHSTDLEALDSARRHRPAIAILAGGLDAARDIHLASPQTGIILIS